MKMTNLLVTALVIVLFASNSWAGFNCGNQGTPPQITSSTIVSPLALDGGGNTAGSWDPWHGRFDVNGIQYISGNAVRVELLTDGCTEIKEIAVGSTVLTPSVPATGTQPNYYWYNAIDTRNDATGHAFGVWVGYPLRYDGSTDYIRFTVRRSGGSGTAVYAFPLVHVLRVQPTKVDAPIGISGAEVHNQFAQGLHNLFGAANSYSPDQGPRLYNYDPASLSTSINSAGIWLSFEVTADYQCQPRVRITGQFYYVTNAPDKPGLSVQWSNLPSVSPVGVTACEIIATVVDGFMHVFTGGVVGTYGSGGDTLTGALTNALNKAAPDTMNVGFYLDGSTAQFDQLFINMKLLAPSVEINVPYDAFAMGRTAMRFPSGQPIALIANGLGMRDRIAGADAVTTLQSGPNGVPRQTASTLSNMFTVVRTEPLFDNSAAVGQVLAKVAPNSIVATGPTDFRYTVGCALTAPAAGRPGISPAAEILFGVNDTPSDAERLRGLDALGYNLRVFFGFPFGIPGPSCADSGSPVNRI